LDPDCSGPTSARPVGIGTPDHAVSPFSTSVLERSAWLSSPLLAAVGGHPQGLVCLRLSARGLAGRILWVDEAQPTGGPPPNRYRLTALSTGQRADPRAIRRAGGVNDVYRHSPASLGHPAVSVGGRSASMLFAPDRRFSLRPRSWAADFGCIGSSAIEPHDVHRGRLAR
jgi:hypothetical protein